tara:strand:- start:352 stop:630 length:279 start_codon:yes stop_codon:yes gene_type:complete
MGLNDLSWRELADCVILSVGDIVIDIVNKQIGVLVNRERRISMEDDDIYFWYITWTAGNDVDSTSSPTCVWIEEKSLKISIYVGFYDLYPTG